MSRPRMIAGTVCGASVFILIAFLLLPYIFSAIGRYHCRKVEEIGSELAVLREKEMLARETGILPGEASPERERLQNLIDESNARAKHAFLRAKALNSASLNDDDLVLLSVLRLNPLIFSSPPQLAASAVEEELTSIRSDLERALQLNPKNKRAYGWLIHTYDSLIRQEPEKASEVCDRYEKAFPDDPDMLWFRAEHTRIDDGSREQLLMKAIEKDSTHLANLALSRMLRKELRFEETVDVLEKWIASKPKPPYAAVAKRELQGVLKYMETIEENKSIVAENPDDIDAIVALAGAYDGLHAYKQARQWYENAYMLSPDDEKIIDQLALMRGLTGDSDGADELYDRLEELYDTEIRPPDNSNSMMETRDL